MAIMLKIGFFYKKYWHFLLQKERNKFPLLGQCLNYHNILLLWAKIMYFITYTEEHATKLQVLHSWHHKSGSVRKFNPLMQQVNFADYLEWGCVPGKQKNIGIGQHSERWWEGKHNVLHSWHQWVVKFEETHTHVKWS